LQRLVEPRPIEGAAMRALPARARRKLRRHRILHGGSSDNLNVEAARLHVLGDLFGSIAASAAAVVILTTGWLPVDALLSLVVAALILRSAWCCCAARPAS
jgi:cobalt-zinc-cadmium efflux system protein